MTCQFSAAPTERRERLAPRLDGGVDDPLRVGGDLDRDEQPRAGLGPRGRRRAPSVRRSAPGSGHPSRYRRTRSSAACSAQRRTRSRSPDAWTASVADVVGVERDPHRSRGGAAVGLGPAAPVSGDRRRRRTPPRTGRHLPGARLAHDARAVDRLLGDTEHVVFGLGRVDDRRPGEVRGGAGDGGDPLAHRPAGERLRAGEPRPRRLEQAADDLLEGLVAVVNTRRPSRRGPRPRAGPRGLRLARRRAFAVSRTFTSPAEAR